MTSDGSTTHGNEERKRLVDKLNSRLVEVDAAEKRYNAAKSELGTARTELEKAIKRYSDTRAELEKRLPLFKALEDDGSDAGRRRARGIPAVGETAEQGDGS